MKQFLLVIVASCSFLTVNSIQCYVCSGKDSYCKNKLRSSSFECSVRYKMDTCYKKIPTNYTGETTVTKLCHVKNECYKAQSLCEKSGKCRVFCCFTDFCNGNTEMVSSVTHAQKWMILIMQILTITVEWLYYH